MNKVLIIGNAGSGKSWLSNRVSKRLNIKEVNLDNIFWEPGGYNQRRSPKIVQKELEKLSLEPEWIVEGVFGALAEKLIYSADMLIFLDIDWEVCLKSLLYRGSESQKQLENDLAEKNFRELLQWASEYNHRDSKSSYSFHNHLFDEFNDKKFRFLTRNEVNSFVNLEKF